MSKTNYHAEAIGILSDEHIDYREIVYTIARDNPSAICKAHETLNKSPQSIGDELKRKAEFSKKKVNSAF